MTATDEGDRTPDASYAGPDIYAQGTRFHSRMKLWDESDNEGEWTNGDDYFYAAGDTILSRYYAYDPVGNVTQVIDDADTPNGHNYVYAYDPLNRLTTLSEANEWLQEVNGHIVAADPGDTLESYTYSAIGNLTNKSDIGNYTYAGDQGTNYANPHAATWINGQTYTYDRNGNLTNKPSWGYVWDYGNRMTSATSSGQTVSFEYDRSGQRTRLSNGSVTRRYANKYYDTDGTTATKHLYLPNGTLIATIEGSDEDAALSFIHTDHLGGTAAVTADGGSRSQFLDYYPFGGTRVDQQLGGTNERHKFTGHEYGDQMGLYYMNARYQNPAIGRFVSEDPAFWTLPAVLLVDPQQQNSYSYARNNPMILVDVTGKLVSENQPHLPSESTYAFNDTLGSYRGLDITSRGPNRSSAESPWQCVDFAKDFTQAQFGVNLGVKSPSTVATVGDAINYGSQSAIGNAFRANNPSNTGLFTVYKNGGSAMPQENDIISWSGGDYGHVGVIAEVNFDSKSGTGWVYSIEQNYGSRHALFAQSLTRNKDNTYSVSGRGHYSVQGWARYAQNQTKMPTYTTTRATPAPQLPIKRK